VLLCVELGREEIANLLLFPRDEFIQAVCADRRNLHDAQELVEALAKESDEEVPGNERQTQKEKHRIRNLPVLDIFKHLQRIHLTIFAIDNGDLKDSLLLEVRKNRKK
jgi:hypothetical protein